jgi:membrane fusion protein, multidrug efflux system
MNVSRFALLLLPAALAACKEDRSAAPPPPRAVISYEVRAETLDGGLFHSGEVRPRQESALGFRIAGKLVERKVDLGDTVRVGQVIARLDRSDPVLAAQAAGSTLAAAEAELDLARLEATRFASLRAQNFVAQAALDARIATLKSAENRAQAARAQADTAGNQAQYADLVADFAGVVSAVVAEPGQVLAAGSPVVRVARTGPRDREVLISLAESRVADLSKNREVRVSTWADPAKSYRGIVREIAPQADPVTRTYAARVVVVDADDAVRLGMTATVTVAGSASGILRVPSGAIVQKDGQPAVWVLSGDGEVKDLEARKVGVAAFREDGAFLSGGLRPGERIVAAGAHRLQSGEKVRIAETR